jgi:hypothetical protein
MKPVNNLFEILKLNSDRLIFYSKRSNNQEKHPLDLMYSSYTIVFLSGDIKNGSKNHFSG